MRKVFIPEVTLGHLMQVGVMVLTVVSIWFKMDTRLALVERAQSEQSESLKALVLNQSAILRTLAALEERTKGK